MSLLRSNGLLNKAKRPVQPAAGFANSRPTGTETGSMEASSQPQWPSVWRSSHFCLTSDSVTFGYHGKSDLLASGRRFCLLCRLAIQQRCQLYTLAARLQGVHGPASSPILPAPQFKQRQENHPFLDYHFARALQVRQSFSGNARPMAHTYPLGRYCSSLFSIAKVFDIHFKIPIKEKGTRDDTQGGMDRA